MWICERHKDENQEALERFKAEYQKNHKLVLGLITTQVQLPALSPRVKRKVSTTTPNSTKPSKKPEASILKTSKEDTDNKSKPAPEHRNISTKEATKN